VHSLWVAVCCVGTPTDLVEISNLFWQAFAGRKSCLFAHYWSMVFEPEEVTALTTAFVGVLSGLGLVDRHDPAVLMIAKRIIELAKNGQWDPILLRDYTLAEFHARPRL
jgi:hypothetical protein